MPGSLQIQVIGLLHPFILPFHLVDLTIDEHLFFQELYREDKMIVDEL
jgi:hypothetical protein